jgi:tetratricopeptide (TPR) repeat protein/tRNA A-37 threonylcarbamoyl transferase component Bud32
VSSHKDNASLQAAAAAWYAELQNFALAERTASAALALDSASQDAYKTRALARAALEDRKGAMEDIRRASAIDPHDESARVLAALIGSRKPVPDLRTMADLRSMKRSLGLQEDGADAVSASLPDEGSRSQAEGAAYSPDSARARALLRNSSTKARLGDYEGALEYAVLAIEKDPTLLEAYLERANALNFLGRYEEAVRDTTFVIQKDPRNLQAFNMRAWALNRNGRSGEAETDASRAIGLNPNFADAWFNRALAYEKQGDYKRMLEDFRQAAALNGEYAVRYQDAVAQYGPRVPGFSAGAPRPYETGAAPSGDRGPLRRFLMLMLFTLTGGGLVALGLVHIITGQQARTSARATHPDVLSPSVFYEGVATGKYRIEKKIGEGGMGQVYQAVDQSLGRKVAIKRMHEEIKVNAREKQRFLEEARTVALLHHPNIVEIHTIFEEEGDVYLVFEFVQGRTLEKVVDAEIRMSFPKLRGIMDGVARALAYAHGKGVVHRDLKLGNIMISDEGETKVMDFGLAHRVREASGLVSNKEVVGSPAYMAPEQETGHSSASSDVYSMGVCMYEALTGVLPFPGPDFHAQKLRVACRPVSESVPGLPPAVDALVARCLDPDPGKRFASAEEFRQALAATEV